MNDSRIYAMHLQMKDRHSYTWKHCIIDVSACIAFSAVVTALLIDVI
jgi:hypothetical protein